MISEREAAKYPFVGQAVDLVETLNINLEDLAHLEYSKVLERAEKRVSQAILNGEASAELEDTLTELLSFPVANIFVNAMGEEFIFRRYALSEAVRAQKLLREEVEIRLTKLSRQEFDWELKLIDELLDGQIYRFELAFNDYLKNASAFREPKWKLVNRLMREGYVLTTKQEISRLLQEEIQKQIVELVTKQIRLDLPDTLMLRVNNLKKIFDDNRSKFIGETFPTELLMEALPPCMKHAFKGLMAGRRASHMERFALTSFLINTKMDVDKIVNLFVSVTDFDENFTRYQIEHIAGLRGGRTSYTTPNCSTLKTHGVCYNPDNLCRQIKNPLTYYARAMRVKKENE
jgi:DNA primase large subunit